MTNTVSSLLAAMASRTFTKQRASTADTQQVSGFEKQQAMIQKSDADARLQQAVAAMNAQEQGMRAQEQAWGKRHPLRRMAQCP